MGLLGLLLGVFAGTALMEQADAGTYCVISNLHQDESKVRDVANPFLKKGEKPKLSLKYDTEKEETFTVITSSNT